MIQRLTHWVVWGPLAVFFVGLTYLSFGEHNQSSFLWLNEHFNRWLPDWVWANVTMLGDATVSVGLLAWCWFCRPKVLLAALVGVIPTTLITRGLKLIFDAPRPPRVLDQELFTVIGPALKSLAFPSGHTATVAFVAAVLAYFFKHPAFRGALFVFVLLAGFSRVAVGAHWPEDVMLGGVIGWFVGMVSAAVVDGLDWRPGRQWHRLAMLLFAISSCFLLFYPSPYPHTMLLQWLVSMISLAAVLHINDCYQPWRRQTIQPDS